MPSLIELANSFLARSFLAKSLLRALTSSYRPERHYMRGPGLKWRAKHLRADNAHG